MLLPNTEVATIEQVAEYYKVETKTLEKVVERKAEELKSNGCKLYKKQKVVDLLNRHNVGLEEDVDIKTMSYKTEVIINNEIIVVPNSGLWIFSKRAILSITSNSFILDLCLKYSLLICMPCIRPIIICYQYGLFHLVLLIFYSNF